MRIIGILTICTFMNLLAYGQLGGYCYAPPVFEFEGTNIDYSFLITDPLVDPTLCTSVTYLKDHSEAHRRPLEYDDKYIMVYRVAGESGSRIMALSKEDNSVLWDSTYNVLNDAHERSFSIEIMRKGEGNTIELNTSRSLLIFDGYNYSKVFNNGLLGKRKIDADDGSIISDQWVGDYVELSGTDYESVPYLQLINHGENYHYMPEENLYQMIRFREIIDEDKSLVMDPLYIDDERFTLIDHTELAYGVDTHSIYHHDENGTKGRKYKILGPIQQSPDTLIYFAKFLLGDVAKYHLLKFDEWGNLYSDKDITSNMNPINKSLRVDMRISYVYDDRVILSNVEKNVKQFYVLDFNGNLLYKNEEIRFDEHKARMDVVEYIPERDSYLHVMKPEGTHDLYIYEEYPDGTYEKRGHLVSKSHPRFVFRPSNVWKMENGDVFIGLKIKHDSISEYGNYTYGQGQGVLKIKAKDLGMTSSTKDFDSSVDRIIYPNPTSGLLQFKDLKMVGSRIEICNMYGQVIISDQLDATLRIDIGDQIPGMYIVRIIDDIGKLIGIEKVIKG